MILPDSLFAELRPAYPDTDDARGACRRARCRSA